MVNWHFSSNIWGKEVTIVVILWRLRFEATLNPKVRVSFIKKKRNKKVVDHKKRPTTLTS